MTFEYGDPCELPIRYMDGNLTADLAGENMRYWKLYECLAYRDGYLTGPSLTAVCSIPLNGLWAEMEIIMQEFEGLTNDERKDVIHFGHAWHAEHNRHVERLVRNERNAVPPSGSDMFRPELWKSIHWKWFIDNHC